MTQKGFTLIELMIVLAIIAILAMVGLPAYQDYAGRAQMSEGLSLAGGQKVLLSEYHSQVGAWPANNQAAGAAADASITGRFVEKVSIDQNKIIATMRSANVSANVQGKTVTLIGSAANGAYSWSCSSDAPPRFLPGVCR